MLVKVTAGEKLKYKEISTNDDGSISLSDLRKHFPNCVGIRYKFRPTGHFRGTLITGDQLHLPLGVRWEDYIFHCVFKDIERQAVEENLQPEPIELETYEMIALGLPDEITDDVFYRYFAKFGKLKTCSLKRRRHTSKSKGYGFIEYEKYVDHNKCMTTKHVIDGVSVSLRLPTSKMNSSACLRQLFVTNITPSVKQEEIIEYFSVFGKITQIFMPPVPTPHAFLTFESENCVARVLQFGRSHRVFGGYVIVGEVHTKQEMSGMNTNGNSGSEQPLDETNGMCVNQSTEEWRDDHEYSEQDHYSEQGTSQSRYIEQQLDQCREDSRQQQQYGDRYYQEAQYEQDTTHLHEWHSQGVEYSQSDDFNQQYRDRYEQSGRYDEHATYPLEPQPAEQYQTKVRVDHDLEHRYPSEQQQQQHERYYGQHQWGPQGMDQYEHRMRVQCEQPPADQYSAPYWPTHPMPPCSSLDQSQAALRMSNSDLAPGNTASNSNYLGYYGNNGEFDTYSELSGASGQREQSCPRRSTDSRMSVVPSRLISDIAASVLDKVTSHRTDDALMRMLLADQQHSERGPRTGPDLPDRCSPSRITRAIEVLQNPRVLDSLLRLSDSLELDHSLGYRDNKF